MHTSKEILNVYAGPDIFVEGKLFVKHIFGCFREVKIRVNTAISKKVVVQNVHATIPKDNMGYDQYTVPDVL